MDAASIGVLHDITLLVWVALLFGAISYKVMRDLRPTACWNWAGRVDARSYLPSDAMIVAAISMVLLAGLGAVSGPVEPSEEPAPTELTVSGTLMGMVIQLGLCVLLLVYLRKVRGLNPAELFGLRQMRLSWVLGAAMMVVIPMLMLVNGSAFAMQEWMAGFWPDMEGQEVVEAFRSSQDSFAKALLVVSAAIIAPLVEETVFRGFIYGVIKRYTDSFFAALCSSLLFAVVHFHVGTLMPLTLLALFFCLVYEMTGCLLLPMLLHALFNGTSLVVMLFFPEAS